jgi:hypothetical protein
VGLGREGDEMVFGFGTRARGARLRTRWIRPAAAVVATGLALSACQWPQVGFGPEHQRHNPSETDLTLDNVASLAPMWSVDVPGARTEPIVADGRVYVTRDIRGTDAGGVWVRALSAADGATVWERQIGSGRMPIILPAPNARFGEQLSAGFAALRSDGSCVATHGDLDPADGSGAVSTDGVVVSPAVTAGSVVVRTSVQTEVVAGICERDPLVVRATDVTTGAELWTASPGDHTSLLGGFMPTVADGRVLVTQGSRLHAYAADGCGAATCAPLWSVDLGALVDTPPPVAGNQGQAFVLLDTDVGGNLTTELVAVSGDDGAVLWRTDLGVPDGGMDGRPWIAVGGDVVYVTSPDNRLRAFAADGCGMPSCEPLWSASISDVPGPPVVAGGVVHVGTTGEVYAFDASGCGSPSCSPVASIRSPGWAGDLSVAQGKLFVAGGDTVTAYAPTQP